MLRFTSSGAPDTTFNGSGLVVTDFNGRADNAVRVVVQLDGKLVVAGSAYIGNDYPEFAVARYRSNGHLDEATTGEAGFGGDGRVTIKFNDDTQLAKGVALQLDGKVVVVGTALIGNDYDFAVARLESDGTLDDNSDGDGGFSSDGKLTTGFGGHEQANAVLVLPDGRLLVAGLSNFGSDLDGYVARYTPTGGLDNSWDGDGKLTVPNEMLLAAAGHSDGKLLVAGFYFDEAHQRIYTLRRLTDSGGSDPTFNAGAGLMELPLAGASVEVSLLQQPDGRVLLATAEANGSQLRRWWPDGHTLDSGGQTAYGLAFPYAYRAGYREYGYGLALDDNGRFMTAGQAYAPDNQSSEAIVTRFSADGMPDANYGATRNGTARVNSGLFSSARAVVVQPSDQKTVMAGFTSFNADYSLMDFLVTRFTLSGLPDQDFGVQGSQLIDFAGGGDAAVAVAVAPDGKIVVAGSAWNGTAYDWGVARLTQTGQLDNSFDGDGRLTLGIGISNTLTAVVVQPDGKIVVGGMIGGDFALARLTDSGQFDNDFGAGGLAVTDLGGFDRINGLALAADGWLYAAGQRLKNGNTDMAIVQYSPQGVRAHCEDPADCDRWPDGAVFVDSGGHDYANAVDVRGDHQLVAAGCAQEHFAAVQVRTDGPPAPTYLNTDFVGFPDCARAVKFQGPNKVLLVGDVELYNFNSDYNLVAARFETTSYVKPDVVYTVLLPLAWR